MTHRPRSWLGSGSGGLCQQHVQLFAPADPGGLETGGERRMRADERRDVAFEKYSRSVAVSWIRSMRAAQSTPKIPATFSAVRRIRSARSPAASGARRGCSRYLRRKESGSSLGQNNAQRHADSLVQHGNRQLRAADVLLCDGVSGAGTSGKRTSAHDMHADRIRAAPRLEHDKGIGIASTSFASIVAGQSTSFAVGIR